MRTLCVVLPLVPLAVGDVVDRAAWVPHVTLVGNIRVPDAALDTAVAVLRAVAGAGPPPAVVVGDEAWFEPNGSVLVDLVEAAELRPAHDRLLGALERHVDGLEIVAPAFSREGYRPHRTVTAGPRPVRGEVLEVSTAVLVELESAGRPGTAVVLAAFALGRTTPEATRTDAGTVHAVLTAVREADVPAWVIGGWGVDALAGAGTRPHHDLDLFVEAAATEAAIAAMAGLGFVVRFVWSENRWTARFGRLVPSAFVAIDGEGHEIDVHTVAVSDGRVTSISTSAVQLPRGALDGRGTIAGLAVPCASVDAQLVMHTGYPLPQRQVADVALLRRLAGS